jgi:beta-glucanase (GH16 family)
MAGMITPAAGGTTSGANSGGTGGTGGSLQSGGAPSLAGGSSGSAGGGSSSLDAGLAAAAPADGVYALHSVHSAKCLSVANDSTQNGAGLTQATCLAGAAQHFALKSLGDGSYSLINQGSGKAMDIKDQSTAAGALVQQWDFAQSPNQRFRLTGVASSIAPPRYEISSVMSSLALSVDGASVADGAAVVQEPWREADEQLWTFEAAPVAPADDAGSSSLAGWTLTWSDEFDGADGSPVDASKWNHDTGGNGWGNQELEYYTADTANARQAGGNLVITATPDGASGHTCWYGACQYTSARLLTSGKYSAAYGRIEARVKMPAGKGLWPAFWMLGDNIGMVNWPRCGEIDIMETVGSDVQTNHGSMHGPGYSGGSPLTATISLPGGVKLSDDFHTYAVEWAPNVVRFYVDTTLYETRTPADIPQGSEWVYNHPFFMLLNLAVGGQWPGSPDASSHFPAQMLVDYVRVYTAM